MYSIFVWAKNACHKSNTCNVQWQETNKQYFKVVFAQVKRVKQKIYISRFLKLI